MPVLIKNRKNLARARSRLTAMPRALMVVIVAVGSGCASAPPPAATLIPIQPTEGARWVSAETVETYGCGAGALVCSGDGGRLSERRCRCRAP